MNTRIKMLVVDDNKELRQSLCEQFLQEGFEVDLAEDGDIALEMIKQKEYAIVLLDVKMPRMDGTTVLQELQKIHTYPKVIMLSVMNDIAIALECVKRGAQDYITKPYDPEELLQVVMKVLNK
ncbi:MAG: response regulator [Ignavibacteriae bacterium]|nr:response regulator [Ignavibacteriota bacterium]